MEHRAVAVVVCGPSGVGKSTIGSNLSEALGCPFVEGDSYHTAANVEKMRSGVPLTDDDRLPWLTRLREEVIAPSISGGRTGDGRCGVVLACSALKRSYRDVLRQGHEAQVCFILLSGDAKLILQRMSSRENHYMPVSLLDSQLATLEPLDTANEYGTTVDLTNSPAQIVADAVQYLSG